MTELLSESGVKTLIKRIRRRVFLPKQKETREAFLMGQKPGGPLSRAAGESMAFNAVRRRRWWTMLREFDHTIQLSANIRGDLLLDQAGLSRQEKQMVLTSTAKDRDFDTIAAALLEQHPQTGYDEDRKGKHEGEKANTKERMPKDNFMPTSFRIGKAKKNGTKKNHGTKRRQRKERQSLGKKKNSQNITAIQLMTSS